MIDLDRAHHDGEEYAWHPDGADVRVWFIVMWVGLALIVLALAGWVIADAARGV